MGMVDVKCKDCYWRAYTVGSRTWYKSGTVTRYPNLYCDSCCGGSHSGYSYSGNVVRMECAGCSNCIVPITWSDWKAKRTQYDGRCNSCRNKKLRQIAEDKARRDRQREAERLEAEQRRLREKKEKELREKREREKKEYLRQKQEEAARAEKLRKMKEALEAEFNAESHEKPNEAKQEP